MAAEGRIDGRTDISHPVSIKLETLTRSMNSNLPHHHDLGNGNGNGTAGEAVEAAKQSKAGTWPDLPQVSTAHYPLVL